MNEIYKIEGKCSDLKYLTNRFDTVGELNNFNSKLIEQSNKTLAELKMSNKKFSQIKETAFPDISKFKNEFLKPIKSILPLPNLQPINELPLFSMEDSHFDVAAFCASAIIECMTIGITFDKLSDPKLLNNSHHTQKNLIQKPPKLEDMPTTLEKSQTIIPPTTSTSNQ